MDDKYLFEFNSRYDGTYKFAKDKRWGFFPSVSAGWNVANEEFWKPLSNTVNQFKIRASWGELGNQLTAVAYQDIPLLGVGSNLGWILNGRRPGYTTAPGLVNEDITWETSNTKNLGFDLGFSKIGSH
ncbi:MAG: TonB-dependent receptor [Spirosomataceae bacterium]